MFFWFFPFFFRFWDALPEGQTQNDPRHFRDVCPVQMRDANGGLFVAYMFALIYFFGGVGVAADAFMGAIEAMTAVTRTVKRDDGSHVQILVWNKTVSNLSLMALGSSAPEIMLAVVGVRLSVSVRATLWGKRGRRRVSPFPPPPPPRKLFIIFVSEKKSKGGADTHRFQGLAQGVQTIR